MRLVLAFLLLGAVFVIPTATWVTAQGKSSGHSADAPKARITTSGAAKTDTSQSATGHGPKSTTATASSTAARNPTNATATKTASSTATAATTNTPAPATLPKNPRVVDRLRALLPPGTDINAAATGFRNQGQFVAAVHVSSNLALRFDDLKARMVTNGMSLSEAIHDMRRDVDAESVASAATKRAQKDLGTNVGLTRYQ